MSHHLSVTRSAPPRTSTSHAQSRHERISTLDQNSPGGLSTLPSSATSHHLALFILPSPRVVIKQMSSYDVSFLPLPFAFNVISPASWLSVAQASQDWLVLNTSGESRKWRWALELFWLAYIGAFPSFPSGAWAEWDPRIPLQGSFIEAWVAGSRSDILTPAVLRYRIWEQFKQVASRHHRNVYDGAATHLHPFPVPSGMDDDDDEHMVHSGKDCLRAARDDSLDDNGTLVFNELQRWNFDTSALLRYSRVVLESRIEFDTTLRDPAPAFFIYRIVDTISGPITVAQRDSPPRFSPWFFGPHITNTAGMNMSNAYQAVDRTAGYETLLRLLPHHSRTARLQNEAWIRWELRTWGAYLLRSSSLRMYLLDTDEDQAGRRAYRRAVHVASAITRAVCACPGDLAPDHADNCTDQAVLTVYMEGAARTCAQALGEDYIPIATTEFGDRLEDEEG